MMNENYINRELSWLKFNKRVLEEAQAATVPDFERLKFIAIFTSNLDEFFMVRAGSMYDRSLLEEELLDNKTGMSPGQQLDAMYRDSHPLYKLRDVYFSSVTQSLRNSGISHRDIKTLSAAEKKAVKQYFKKELVPLLSPQIIDAKHPFPHLENKKLYVFVLLKKDGKQCWGILPLPPAANRVLYLSSADGISYLLAEDVLLRYADDIFKLYSISAKAVIKVTRNADIEVEDNFSDDDIDYREYVKLVIKRREKLAPIRLELYYNSVRKSEKIQKHLEDKLKLGKAQCFVSQTPLDMGYVFALEDKILPDYGMRQSLFYTPLVPQYRRDFNPLKPLTAEIEKRDMLLSYPYYSMKPYLMLLEEAADDKSTISIKITLYRLSNNSEVINLLCRAADNGIEVTAVVELKARFDEANNINWSHRLEESGCNVIYGVEGIKIHSKITLITRRTDDGITHTVHLGTGNYNEKTAKVYTDLGIITSDTGICADAVTFFQNVTLGSGEDDYRHLLIAPGGLKRRFLDLISQETDKGSEGYIRLKMNSMTDKEIIDALMAASQAGVKIDLIIRGICCLKPGIAGVSDNIDVYSIVGRFLEHSRIFVFGRGENRKLYIGSADLMTRNTSRRIEILAPVYDKAIAAEIYEMTEYMLADNVKRSKLCSNGEYEHIITDSEPFDSQLFFYRNAYEQAQ